MKVEKKGKDIEIRAESEEDSKALKAFLDAIFENNRESPVSRTDEVDKENGA